MINDVYKKELVSAFLKSKLNIYIRFEVGSLKLFKEAMSKIIVNVPGIADGFASIPAIENEQLPERVVIAVGTQCCAHFFLLPTQPQEVA
jgi:hypothetical protein